MKSGIEGPKLKTFRHIKLDVCQWFRTATLCEAKIKRYHLLSDLSSKIIRCIYDVRIRIMKPNDGHISTGQMPSGSVSISEQQRCSSLNSDAIFNFVCNLVSLSIPTFLLVVLAVVSWYAC